MVGRKIVFISQTIAYLTLASAVLSCVHPMGISDIEELTTCPKNVDLAAVKKNLLLSGYGISHASDEELITDYKQSYGRNWQRITAIKMGEVVKFKVRIRRETVESVPTTTTQTSVISNSDRRKKEKGTEVITQEKRVERIQNEYDQDYYIERRGDYLSTKQEVCGAVY